MVPQKLTNWKAPHVTDLASAVHCLFFIGYICLFFLLPPSHWSLFVVFLLSLPFIMSNSFSSPHSSFTCPLIQILLHLSLSPSSPFSREALTTRSRFASYFHKPLKASHFRIFHSRATHQLCHSHRDVGTQAISQTRAPKHTHTSFLLHTCFLNLPLLIGFYHTKTFANKPSSNKGKDGNCWRQETAQFIYRFINVWMQRS